MKAEAFCPAHVTGFFKAEERGSLGAGFCLELGVYTEVEAGPGSGTGISVRGRGSDLAVSEWVAEKFRKISGFGGRLEVRHELEVPPGYGLGCSAAAALSLSYALDEALGAGLGHEKAASVAHEAELACKTGLGDVLAAYHGGFEIRTSAGGPGRGAVQKMDSADLAAAVACFAPVPTSSFMKDRMHTINGLGGEMVRELRRGGGAGRFQDMSMEFAEHAGMDTPRVRRAADVLRGAGLRCGVAMVGETVFALDSRSRVELAARRLRELPGAEVLVSGIGRGARSGRR